MASRDEDRDEEEDSTRETRFRMEIIQKSGDSSVWLRETRTVD